MSIRESDYQSKRFSAKKPVGRPTVSGMLYLIVGANHLMTASGSYIGLPSNNATIITLSALYMTVYTTEILSFHEHYHLSGTSTKSHPLSIRPVTSTINSYRFSFFVNSPFLWNSIPYAILQLKKSTMFRSALHRYLF